MNTEITEITKELLVACKKAGYERITIFVVDERVPESVIIEKGSTGAYWGHGTGEYPFKIICGAPECRDGRQPAMWGIIRKLGLTAGLMCGGCGSGDGMEVHPHFCTKLTAGYYDLENVSLKE